MDTNESLRMQCELRYQDHMRDCKEIDSLRRQLAEANNILAIRQSEAWEALGVPCGDFDPIQRLCTEHVTLRKEVERLTTAPSDAEIEAWLDEAVKGDGMTEDQAWDWARRATVLMRRAKAAPIAALSQDESRRALIEKAHEFWRQFPDARKNCAVVWLSDDDRDALLIFTRGEYRHRLLDAVRAIEAQPHFVERPFAAGKDAVGELVRAAETMVSLFSEDHIVDTDEETDAAVVADLRDAIAAVKAGGAS